MIVAARPPKPSSSNVATSDRANPRSVRTTRTKLVTNSVETTSNAPNERDLGDDERGAPSRMSPRDHGRAAHQERTGLDSRGVPGRNNSKEHACGDRGRHRDCQHA